MRRRQNGIYAFGEAITSDSSDVGVTVNIQQFLKLSRPDETGNSILMQQVRPS